MDTTGFSWDTTAQAAIAGIDLHGIRAIVTGGSSGIGAEAARVLAAAGAAVTLTGRNEAAGRKVVAEIATQRPDADARFAMLDLADPASVEAFAQAQTEPLHLLINNAGVMALPERTTNVAGHELQFATNHLGHFALAESLHPLLSRGAHEAVVTEGPLGRARVVSLSSRGHLRAPVDFDDVDFKRRAYDGMLAYGQSKTANVLFAVEAARRWADDGITANAVHPGAILETNLSRHMDPAVLEAARAGHQQQFKSIPQGAATTIVVATAPAQKAVSGRYFEDCQQAAVIGPEESDIAAQPRGVAWYALDAANANRLWELSEQLT
jgi:NAD(P)-dependent dehydrogenase (short-subunit alcohol dehydrogenase family)